MNAPQVPSPLAGLKREIEVWAGLLFLGTGAAMLIIAADLALTELRYAREAIVVPATVLERDFIPADRADNRTTRYRIRYRYAVGGAQPQELAEEVGVERWEARAPGRQFDLAVLPGGSAVRHGFDVEAWRSRGRAISVRLAADQPHSRPTGELCDVARHDRDGVCRRHRASVEGPAPTPGTNETVAPSIARRDA